MSTLITHPTATAQWHALIHEAEHTCQTSLGEELQSYLVFLLMRYVSASEFATSILALDYLNSFEMHGRLRQEQLRDVGDKCLLYSGLFPGQAERRRVRISYYVTVGKSAYAMLAHSLAGIKAKVFQDLSYQFVLLMDILQATRELDSALPTLQPLQAIELWNDTGSQRALTTLSRYTQGTPVHTDPFEPMIKSHDKPHYH